MANKKPIRQDERRVRGQACTEAAFPAAPPIAELPGNYLSTLEEIKQRIQKERLRVIVSANQAMVLLYWDLGRLILERQGQQGWGAKVIDRLAADLRAAFPGMRGFSPRNLLSMRGFAEAYPEAEIVKQVVSQLPWGHVLRLLQREKDPETRAWYARQAVTQGWSRSILELQMDYFNQDGRHDSLSQWTIPCQAYTHLSERGNNAA